MRESRTYGSVRGALSNERPYRDREALNFNKRNRIVRRAHQGARAACVDCAGGTAYSRLWHAERQCPRLCPSYGGSIKIKRRHFPAASK